MYAIDTKLLQRVSNHPVHIMNSEGLFSPSSFIPFCSFGEEFLGEKNEEFDIPLCNIFKAKPYFDQLCYEMDLQELKDSPKLENQLKFGLTLVLDYNEERQINFNSMTHEEGRQFTRSIYHKGDESFSVYADTISILKLIYCRGLKILLFLLNQFSKKCVIDVFLRSCCDF